MNKFMKNLPVTVFGIGVASYLAGTYYDTIIWVMLAGVAVFAIYSIYLWITLPDPLSQPQRERRNGACATTAILAAVTAFFLHTGGEGLQSLGAAIMVILVLGAIGLGMISGGKKK